MTEKPTCNFKRRIVYLIIKKTNTRTQILRRQRNGDLRGRGGMWNEMSYKCQLSHLKLFSTAELPFFESKTRVYNVSTLEKILWISKLSLSPGFSVVTLAFTKSQYQETICLSRRYLNVILLSKPNDIIVPHVLITI